MNTFLKNPEIKSFLIKLLLIHVIFITLLLIFVKVQFSTINEKITEQNTALVGQLLYNHPEFEDEIIKDVTRTASPSEIQKGKDVLKNYGYSKNITIDEQPLLRTSFPYFNLKTAGFALIYLIPLSLLAIFEYNKIYKKINILSSASEDVVEGNFKTIKNDNNEGDFAILSNNFNNMAGRLKQSLESLKQDKLFLKNIISDISHQLKTPLSSLSAINDILLEDENVSSYDAKDFLKKSRSQLDRMEWLIINLLKMARLEAGAVQFKCAKFPIMNSIKYAVSSLSIKADKKNIAIHISGDESTSIYGDENWIAEALSNIIKNSIEHTNAGGKIDIILSETTIFSSVIIQDNGEGIDKKDILHIFERFYKGSNSLNAESVGIGLALSKVIIESQNGSISVTSQKGEGSKFTITFLKGVI